MIALLVETFGVRRVKGVPLASHNELLLRLYLVGVVATGGSSYAHKLVVNVKDEVVLPHQRATNYHFASVLNVECHTVAIGLLTVEVLTWVPLKLIVFLFRTNVELEDGEGPKVVVRAVFELAGIVRETKVSAAVEVHLALAVVFRVY